MFLVQSWRNKEKPTSLSVFTTEFSHSGHTFQTNQLVCSTNNHSNMYKLIWKITFKDDPAIKIVSNFLKYTTSLIAFQEFAGFLADSSSPAHTGPGHAHWQLAAAALTLYTWPGCWEVCLHCGSLYFQCQSGHFSYFLWKIQDLEKEGRSNDAV